MVPTLATSSPAANESRTVNSMRSALATVVSQNAEIAAWPRRPLPSGSNSDGPTGSSTTASGANSANHSSFAPRDTASMDRRDASRARWLCSGADQSTFMPSHPVDDLVGEPLEAVLLVAQLVAEPDAVQHPRHHHRVGHPDLRLPPIAVQPEAVHAHRLDLERRVRPPVLGAERVQLADRVPQLVESDHR